MAEAHTVNSKGIKSIGKDLRRLFRRIDDTKPIMGEIALLLDKGAKESLLGPRSGRIYKAVKKPRKPKSQLKYRRRIRDHQASAEGEAPKGDSGDLRSSIDFAYSKDEAIAGSRIFYSKILEDPDKLNRPWLSTVSREARPNIQRIIQRHLKRANK